MFNKIIYYLGRIKEEGYKNSLLILYKRLQFPVKESYFRYKILHSHREIPDKCFYNLINLKGAGLRCVKESVKKGDYAEAQTGLINHFTTRNSPSFYIDSKERKRIVKIFISKFPSEVKEIIKTADLICQHKFKWLSPNCPDFGDKIRWHSNFLDDREWPLDFFMDIDYSSDKRLGDVRQVWELNRHQYFITLGKAYWITEDSKYADEFINQISDWIDTNPYGYGINWLHSQETAIRSVSWIWAFFFFIDYPGFDEEQKIKMLKSLSQHAEYTLWNLSNKRLITHNHLISEVCGLSIIGVMFPEFKNAVKWGNTGIKIFENEVIKQIWEDGLSSELATNYHLFVLDSFLQLLIILKKNRIYVSINVEKRIEKMIECVMYLCKPDGSIPFLGDSDSGRAFRLSEYNINDRRGYLVIGSILYKRGDFKKIAGKFYEEAFWLLGENGLEKFEIINERNPDNTSRIFYSGGLAIFRKGWDKDSDYLILRGGPTRLRKGVSWGHNHADSLSFELYSKGKTVLVDPGTFLYGLDDKWRFYFRKTSAHNTIVIDNRDQNDVSDTRFGLKFIPLSNIHKYSLEEQYDYIDITHNGYIELGILHRRKVVFVKGFYVIILDLLSGKGKHEIEQFFNFDRSDLLIDKNNNIYTMCDDGSSSIGFVIINPERLNLDVFKGSVDPIIGWCSSRYGEKHSASVLRCSLNCEFPVVLGALIIMNIQAKIEVKQVLENENNYKIDIRSKNFNDYIKFNESGIDFVRKYHTTNLKSDFHGI